MYDTKDFIRMYSETKSKFAFDLTENLSKVLNQNNKLPKSMLDLACGTGLFLSLMQKKYNMQECVGLDLSKEMHKFAKSNFKDSGIQFVLGDMTNFNFDKSFDLVTCNYDAINHLLKFSDWEKVFELAFKHLNKGGIFAFDFNTILKMQNYSNSTWYTEYDGYNLVSQATLDKGILTFIDTIYLKKGKDTYKMIKEICEEKSFEIEKIEQALQKVGFSKIKFCDNEYKPIKTPNVKRIFVICEK